MSTPFEKIYKFFLTNISSYEIGNLIAENEIDKLESMFESFLINSIPEFDPYCKKDLEYDDIMKEFTEDLSLTEQKILGLNMVKTWLSRHINHEQMVKQHLGGKDYQIHSPANHLGKLLELRDSISYDIDKLVSLYYYS